MIKSFSLKALITITGTAILLSCNNESTPKNDVQPLNIEAAFVPCGWMGDGESGKQYISFDPKSDETPYSGNTCIKISYKTGPYGWAGMYWLNNDCNWGDELGYDLSSNGFSKITFWGRGEKGGESAQFKAGGVNSKQYTDSFNCEPKLYVEFNKEWTKYTIDLSGKNLSNVIGGFCWISNTDGTIFLDDLQYE